MSGELHRKESAEKSRRNRCESPRESDVDDGGDGDSRPSVLWEKRFEQSIFVDIGDDDSLHLSDLQDSFTVRVSPASAVSGSGDTTSLSNLCEAEESSLESSDSISDECKNHDEVRDMKVPMKKVLTPQWKHTDDTSDDDQEELPFDSELLRNDVHFNNVRSNDTDTFNKPSRGLEKEDDAIYNMGHPIDECQEPRRVSHSIPDVLLRHFSQVKLLKCNMPIEAETLPEVSLLDSLDETILSRASLSKHASTGSHSMKPSICPSLQEENENGENDENHITSEGTYLNTSSTRSVLQSDGSTDKLDEWTNNQSKSPEKSMLSCASQPESSICSVLMPAEEEKKYEKNNVGQDIPPNQPTEICHSAERCLLRARSCGELKYGQGQVHYPLPDFSKVAPKVKIPKGSVPAKPVCQSPATNHLSSVQGILGKPPPSCRADVISRVLEDSVWLTDRRGSLRDKEKQSKLDQFLQAEYDKLLTKYADDDNLIRPPRIKDQTQASSEPSLSSAVTVDVLDITCSKDMIGALTQTSRPVTAGLQEKRDAVPNVLTKPQNLTDGERFTSELTDIIKQFMEKVEEFKTCISNLSMTVEEQQMVFKSLMEAQDQLERNYMSKKEEHRALEMQNYMGFDRNTGEFDPDRQVEGQIFRLGMYLEDIKEQIDRNAHCELCPPQSSSTSISPLLETCTSPSSLQPSLHEESVFSFSTINPSEGGEGQHFKITDERPKPVDMLLSCSPDISFGQQGKDCMASADEGDKLHDFLAQLTNSPPPQQHFALCRLEDIDTYNEDPPQEFSDKTQRFVIAETDSGFSNSDLSRPPTRLSDTQCNAECLSPSSPSDDIESISNVSMLDHEESNSNLLTVVSNASWDGWAKKCGSEPDQPSSNIQNPQLKYISQKAPLELHTCKEAPLYKDVAVPPLRLQHIDQEQQSASSSVERLPVDELTSRENHNQRQNCSCQNSEAIRALQYEVSCLKRALQDSLAHLPLLNRRTDSLNSVCSLEKRHRSRPRPRHQHRAAFSRRLNTDPSLRGSEVWIGSDMENSTGKGTDSGESDHAEKPISSCPRVNTHSNSRTPFSRKSNDLKQHSTDRSRHSTNHQRDTVEPISHESDFSTRSSSRASVGLGSYDGNSSINSSPRVSRSTRSRPLGENRIKLKDRHCHLPSGSPHKPLLQVSYGSCSSLPPGLKMQDHLSDSGASSRRRSTQSDSALLPNNVYFQPASPCPASPRRSVEGSRRQRVSKEEAINRSLDKALKAALMMKQTTDRISKTLSADLAKAQLYRKSHVLHPLSDKEQL